MLVSQDESASEPRDPRQFSLTDRFVCNNEAMGLAAVAVVAAD